MKLDIILPTFNRQGLLSRTLDSLLAADIPPGLDVRVTVVDNNSKINRPGSPDACLISSRAEQENPLP